MRTLLPAALVIAIAVVRLCSIAPCAAARQAPLIAGGWRPITDVSNAHIQELGGWAVAEHVRQAHDGLRFARVVSAEEQVVSGINYKLFLEATNGDGKRSTYGAVLYEGLDSNRQLKAFAPAN